MAKRIIKIILVLLAIFLLLLGGMWLLGRHEATKNGKTPLSFRQFLGLGTSQKPATTAPGTLSSTFTPGDQPSSNGLSNTNPAVEGGLGQNNGNSGTDNIQVSQFTNDTVSPADNTNFNSTDNVGTGSGLGTDTTTGAGNGIQSGTTANNTGLGNTSPGSGLGSTTNNCTAADTAITFTPQEIQELNTLQTQYNAVAANLSTNDDVSTELANYTTYKLEEAKIAEMQSFCQATTPLLTDPEMKRHVPTPFWHDLTQDVETYTPGDITAWAQGQNPSTGEAFLERVLRINLW